MADNNLLVGKMQRIMNIRSQGYATDFQFPSIAVIGSQSSGKSSVLESIVGKHFLPRGTNMITRCPIVLNLIHEVEKDEYAQFAPSEFEEHPLPINDFALVREEISKRTDQITQGKHLINDRCIVLNIHSRNYPNNLELVDLPGFVRNPVADQPSDIKEQIEELVRKIIARDNTIILAVSDARVDIAESAGISESTKVDPEGLRTIGVLTKIDILPTEKVEDVQGILKNNVLPLAKGYIAVINSPNDNDEEDIEMIRKKEMDLFRNSTFKLQHCGTQKLVEKLSNELADKVREKIPELIAKVNEEIDTSEGELERMGYKDEGTSSTMKLLIGTVRQYESAVTVMLDGNSEKVSDEEIQGGAMLKNLLQKQMKEARDEAMSLNPVQFGKRIDIMLENIDASRDAILPNSLVFRKSIILLVEKFKRPLICLINIFTEELIHHLGKCADDTLSDMPNLKGTITEMIKEKVLHYSKCCKDDITKYINIQKVGINISHPEFKQYKNIITGLKASGDIPTKTCEEASSVVSTGDEESHVGDDETNKIKMVKKRVTTFLNFPDDTNDEVAKMSVPIGKSGVQKGFYLDFVLAYMLILETDISHTAINLIRYNLLHNIIQYHENHELYVTLLEGDNVEKLVMMCPLKKEKLESLLRQREICCDVLKVLRDV